MNEEGGGKKKKSKSSIDLLTIIGVVLCLGLMVFGIVFSTEPELKERGDDVTDAEWADELVKHEKKVEKWQATGGTWQTGNMGSFIDYPSIAITVGGCFAALMVAYPASVFGKLGAYVRICVMPTKYDPQDYIATIVDFAKEARIKGLLSLEDKLNETNDPFLKSSLMLVVDSVEPEKVHDLLQAELEKMDERHSVGRNFMDSGGGFAPGFGMIGTLIGLVNMLKDMDDPSSIGPSMAVALLTTLYGSLLANVFFTPMGNKLTLRHNEEYLCLELICQGVEAIQAGENPKFIEEKLNMMVIQSKKGKKSKKAAAVEE